MTAGDFIVFYLLPALGALLLIFCIYAVASANQLLSKLNSTRQVVKALGLELQVSLLGLFLVASAVCLVPAVAIRYFNFTKQITDLNTNISDLRTQLALANKQHPLDWPVQLRFDDPGGLPTDVAKIKCVREVRKEVEIQGTPDDLKTTDDGRHNLLAYLPEVLPTDFVSFSCYDFVNPNHVWSTAFSRISEVHVVLTKAWTPER